MRPRHVMLQLCGHTHAVAVTVTLIRSQVRRAALTCWIPRRSVGSASQAYPWKRKHNHETIELPVGVSGRVRLDVFSPYSPSPSHAHAPATQPHESRNLVVYLPRGPWISNKSTPATTPLQSQETDTDTDTGTGIDTGADIDADTKAQAYLRAALPPATWFVTINYRLGGLGPEQDSSQGQGEVRRFPIPIHDVSTAFQFLTSSTSPFNHGHDSPPKICLVGSHIGGALATMLALTEPNNVHALAALEPMVDWVGLDEVVEQLLVAEARKRHTPKTAARYGVDNGSVLAAAEELIRLRAKLFETPSSYFDPFASPMLFLRAPGRDTPLGNTVGDRLVAAMGLDHSDGGEWDHDEDAGILPRGSTTQAPTSLTPAATDDQTAGAGLVPDDSAASSTVSKPTPRRRKVLHRWPAVGNPDSVLLPHVKVFVQGQGQRRGATVTTGSDGKAQPVDVGLGLAALMRTQGIELAELMRRACFFGRERGFAEERVLLHEQGGPLDLEHEHERESGRGREHEHERESEHESESGDHEKQRPSSLEPRTSTRAAADPPAPLPSAAVQWIQNVFQQD
ncbi:hypothetical protein A1O3_07199 [Capronia epimyces CBS 606.96]|uniref:Alpha/beta hydrolase fold-3 domain-containing protein n=1 Tax=Capronia epimyces CBS 606.96 TaxID=1182542 RepID=W9XVA6_9EURO|nr:uncharacterized protein A1O3_07199 [Capronia epimyces CBS 606.96]EXJ80911.1 hypothetical protein A1O3_07199 [Capronia epimyces CBS 606.96]